MKKRRFKFSNLIAKSMIGLAMVAGGTAVVSQIATPTYAWTASSTSGNESFGFTYVKNNGLDSYTGLTESMIQSFYEVVGSYSIAAKGNYTLKTKITGRNIIYNHPNNECVYDVDSLVPVYNSSYDEDEYGDHTGYDDKTRIGKGDGWRYAIENQGEIKFVYGLSSDYHDVEFSKPLTSTMYIYIPFCYESGVYDAYSNVDYTFYVAKYAFSVSLDSTAPTIKLVDISTGNTLNNGAVTSNKVRCNSSIIRCNSSII